MQGVKEVRIRRYVSAGEGWGWVATPTVWLLTKPKPGGKNARATHDETEPLMSINAQIRGRLVIFKARSVARMSSSVVFVDSSASTRKQASVRIPKLICLPTHVDHNCFRALVSKVSLYLVEGHEAIRGYDASDLKSFLFSLVLIYIRVRQVLDWLL